MGVKLPKTDSWEQTITVYQIQHWEHGKTQTSRCGAKADLL